MRFQVIGFNGYNEHPIGFMQNQLHFSRLLLCVSPKLDVIYYVHYEAAYQTKYFIGKCEFYFIGLVIQKMTISLAELHIVQMAVLESQEFSCGPVQILCTS